MPWIEGVYKRPTNEEFAALGANKLSNEEFSQLKVRLIDKIDTLTIIELDTLVSSLNKHFGVILPAFTYNHEEESAPEEEEKEYKVSLIALGESRVAIIKEIRKITGFGLKESSVLTKTLPSVIKTHLSKEKADAIVASLEAAGATVNVEDAG